MSIGRQLLRRLGILKWSCLLAPAVSLGIGLSAQTSKPTFEVASVRRNLLGPRSVPSLPSQVRPGGMFIATNQVLDKLVAFAYGIDDFQLIGGPGWIRDEQTRFDVNAKVTASVSNEQLRLMMQSVLEDRFALVTHREQREMPVYSLVLARDDGRLGSGLQRVDECPEKPPTLANGSTLYSCGPISVAARIASRSLGLTVVDKTGLNGTFTVAVYFSTEGVRSLFGPMFTPPADPNLPSFHDALRDQLGLRLDAGRGSVDVLVIDSVQQPTED